LDEQGNLYVADTGNQRVQVFDAEGEHLISVVDARFVGPRYVAVDDSGRIYVADAAERVHVFDARGEPLQSFGQPGSLPNQFSQIADLIIDTAGDLYVVDTGNARIQKLNLLTGLLTTFGDTGDDVALLSRPQGIAANPEGDVYVGDATSGRILKYASDGTLINVLDTGIGELRDIAVDSQGYLYGTDGADGVVCVIDPSGGTQSRLGEGQLSDPWGVAVDAAGRVYVSDAGHHRILVLEVPSEVPPPAATPSAAASATATLVPAEGSSPWPMYGGDPQHTGRSVAQGPTSPSLKWTFRAGLLAESPAMAADGTLYFGSLDGNLYAVNADGTEIWRSAVGQISGMPALSTEDVIYVGAASPVEEMFHALNRDGTVAWSYHLEGYIVEASPLVGPDGTLYLAASNPQTGTGSVVALSADGSERWRYDVASRLPFSPAMGSEGTLYVGTGDGKLCALDPEGSALWQAPLGEVNSSCAVGSAGTIYIGTAAGYQALNPKDGSVIWSFSPPAGSANSTPTLGPEGTLYVTSSENELYALSREGALVWAFSAQFEEEREVHFSSPATIDSEGMLYVGTREGEVLAIGPDGSLLWRSLLPEGGMILVGAAIGSDGTLYVGAGSNMYAIAQS
jgi:outer membrane protein assembly factor BamB